MMLAFEVSTKSGRLCTGGLAEPGCPLSCIVTNVWTEDATGKRSLDAFTVSVHGLRPGTESSEQLWWQPTHRLEPGEELTVRLVEVPDVDPPTKVTRARRPDETHPTCSFCGRTKDDVRSMTYSSNAAICDVCVQRFGERLSRH